MYDFSEVAESCLQITKPATKPISIIVEWEEDETYIGLLAFIENGVNGPAVSMDRPGLPDTVRFLADLAQFLGPQQEQED